MRNKKAALELSVTAIVVLILAIVMLGLGLGFVRGMFGKVSTTFEEQVASEPEPPAASGAEPITLSRETLITHASDPEVLKVAFYNPSSQTATISNNLLSCSTPTTSVVSAQAVNSQTVNSSQSAKFNYLLTISSTAVAGTNLCKISIVAGSTTYTKDLIIKVTK